MQRKPLKFVSLFSGCGGMDLGFEQAGFEGILACDIDTMSIKVHNSNLKTPGLVVDLGSKTPTILLRSNPDVVIAGPPCQGFSTLGKRLMNDPRNSLILAAARHAVAIKPKMVVLENVAGAISGAHGAYWRAAEQILTSAGYTTATHPIVSAHFGVPQIRRRVLLVAWRGNDSMCLIPQPIKSVTLGESLKGIQVTANHEPRIIHKGSTEFLIAKRIGPNQKLCNVRGGDRAVATWDIPMVFGEVSDFEREVLLAVQKLRRQIRLRVNGDADPQLVDDVSAEVGRDVKRPVRRLLAAGYLRQIGDRIDLAHTFNGKYRRLSWEHLAPAVDTRFGEPRYFLHPDEHRGLSVREAARIQGFPDTFEFSGSRNAQYRMVGNAVPPPLAKQIAIAIRSMIA